MSDLECADIIHACQLLPTLRCKFKLYVEDEDEIAERDLVTLLLAFERTNLMDGDLAPPVHAPRFPLARLETWWILVSDFAGNLIFSDKVKAQTKVVDHRIKFLAPPQAGTYVFNVDLKSSDYLGLDIHEQVRMVVIPAAQLPEYTAHPDDLNLDDEPTLFEQVMSGNADSDSESDDAHDVDHNDKHYESQDEALTVAERRRRKARIQRKNHSKQSQ